MMMLSVSFVVMVVGIISSRSACGAVSHGLMEKIDKINGRGPYLGIVVPNSFDMILQVFCLTTTFPTLIFQVSFVCVLIV